MFLGILSKENKERFINLCSVAVAADGVVVEAEKDMIFAYCREMNIEEHMPGGARSLDELLNEIKNDSSDQERKIIAFETLALLYADDEYTPEEEELMVKIVETLEIDKASFAHTLGLFDIYKTVYKELCNNILL